MSILTSVLEVASISSLLPLLSALINPGQLATLPVIGSLFDLVNAQSDAQILAIASFLFCGLAVLAGAARFLLTNILARLSYAIGSDFALGIYLRAIRRPLSEQLKSNSSDVISAVSIKSEIVVRQFLFPILTIANSSVLSVAIIALLFVASPIVTIASSLSFGLLYLAVHLLTHKRLRTASETIDTETNRIVKKMQEGLGSVRDIILDGNHKLYERDFVTSETPLRRARADIQIISQVPRYVIEAGGFVLFGALAYVLASRGMLSEFLPGLGVLALGLQRLLPTLQQAYAAWACIQGARHVVASTLEFLDLELPLEDSATRPMSFNRSIDIDAVHFSYGVGNRRVLNGISFQIKKGTRLGIVGKTGSGKSTLLDIMMGLLAPTGGTVRVDGVEIDFRRPGGWHKLVAHVPQSIFIADASIRENIALGVDRKLIDSERVHRCAEKAQLAEFHDQLPQGLDTVVGERGAWLSGGQRQRIGIARALYKSATLLVLDEATGALDEGTESAVMQSIEELGDEITIVMVAHKMASLRFCDQIIELRNGAIYRVGIFQDFADGAVLKDNAT
ncbi:ABC transporter ATP-binding protein [Devosia sp.]|uniref:ABC transporter ATP-binding protein n=1 Tax=Devosia sp. TaxID=1871048 RepID=UPI002735B8E0|nr:ABC transporter ATP-binding protein [Devosia sp.]MDP2782153.1 ABC transporter ATP-binding protein [Devosia sp.]